MLTVEKKWNSCQTACRTAQWNICLTCSGVNDWNVRKQTMVLGFYLIVLLSKIGQYYFMVIIISSDDTMKPVYGCII